MRENSSRRRRLKPRRRSPPCIYGSAFDRTAFPLLLAAAAAGEHQKLHALPILRRFLRARLSLLRRRNLPTSSSSSTSVLEYLLPGSLVSLLPLLLTSRWPAAAALGAEAVGTAALYSLEANEILALDRGVVTSLLRALGNRSRRVVKAACHAVMDLSISPVGGEQLRKAFAVERLLSLFYQESKVHDITVDEQGVKKGTNGYTKRQSTEEKFEELFLSAAVILINSSTEESLDRIPGELIRRCFPLLLEFWKKIRGSSVTRNQQKYRHFTEFDLAITIFKLSMNHINLAFCDIDKIRTSIFGTENSNFENFILTFWENSPFLLNGPSTILVEDNATISSLIHHFNFKSTDNILESILMELVSCPPLASDELDINCFLNEVNSSLGSPLIYGQDIRVLRAQLASESFGKCMKKEVHFFESNSGTLFIGGKNAHKCKEAFQNGFSIALRGLEFRFSEVAAVAEGLADLFGQPSVGANLYLTPPGSQGLTCHYDDHCVFVWQLCGEKHWTISSSPASLLPRLYEPLNSLHIMDNEIDGSLQIVLNKGDILYIPRGFVHEAHTKPDACEPQDKMSSGISLHLTLSVEVEPPFEWEGFAHVALHCWHLKEKELSHYRTSSKTRTKVFSVLLLHVAIRLVADANPIFRRACLVDAKCCSSNAIEEHHAGTLRSNQKVTFWKIVDAISSSSNFLAALAPFHEGNDDTFQWMRWLQNLPQHGDENEKIDYGNPLRVRDELLEMCSTENWKMRDEFVQTKSKFCSFVVYEDARKMFHMMLEKYRRTRRQYMKGMLSLNTAK